MPRLVACSSCSTHVKVQDVACPHCGAALQVEGAGLGRMAGAVLLGLSLAGCTSDGGDKTTVGDGSTGTTMATAPASSEGSDGTDSLTSTTNGETSVSDTTLPGTTTFSEDSAYGVPSTSHWDSSSGDTDGTDTDADTDTGGTTGTGTTTSG